ncbi:hypothetical protein ACWD6Q_16360 [Streptomyces nigra]|uniref:Serine protease n=1 Tax=Streptomyces nigra TaxID=1827580 RepID=A0ABZ1IVN4_9ACTN|nr:MULTISPECIES: hypothetical protein [Streptomyces]AWE51123.1 hypothetical protein DC008_16335 [Streptomyces nigra]MBQ0997794.1 hypothetical protein [Streptomyces sp. RK62]MCF2540464.1 hypothetical protein [Streptomyces sp. FB2]RDS60756.1 hypothetical protein DWC19_34505 [Streptomyces sp. M7]
MKKAIAGAGVVLGGVAALLATQAPAQAAAPSVTTSAAQAAEHKTDAKQPRWVGSVARAAVVHGRALAGTQAIRSQVGNVVRIASLGSAPADTTSNGASVEEVFDK